MNFHKFHTTRSVFRLRPAGLAGFTLVEGLVSIAIIGVGVAVSLTGLTTLNSYAAISRNNTGAYTTVQTQIDSILDNGPFNPQKKNANGTAQIPPELTLGTTVKNNVPIYEDPATGVVVAGTLTTEVTDVSTLYYGFPMYMYQATVTASWQYRGRGPVWSAQRNRWEYQVSMSTVRTSDI